MFLFIPMRFHYRYHISSDHQKCEPQESHYVQGISSERRYVVTSMTRSTKHWLLVSRKRALSLMDKETEDETSPRPKKTKKTVRLQQESEPEADQSNAEEEVEDQLAGEEDALAEDDGDKDDTNSRGNTIKESGDDGDDAYANDDAEKERESWTDLDDEVSAVDIIVPRSLICSSLLDCSG